MGIAPLGEIPVDEEERRVLEELPRVVEERAEDGVTVLGRLQIALG